MKLKYPLIAAFVAMLSLTACGGGGGNDSNANMPVSTGDPAQLTKTDIVVGTGTEATTGKTATVTYTGWLYDTSKSDHKGVQFETGGFFFKVGVGEVIPGFDQGVTGMKVGGKRKVEIPSSLAYKNTGNWPKIPPNAGLVFEIELTKVE
ncbi:FKBP-type peptidyl-prolyl cis-trans isomerase [Massilia horti]|uniref:Peptidyl-prolyl cis-trans isomerase n=1 Tax=Massilia horti TaxID=2562153 RepID=A0A4Y9T195_9BURK|nr:FKBP-type peptidyl-prolyl cis-trans isomerase [Massilia horti]TFW32690.1 FKBP-type peptidyl-prolyl cis-trans isomerase [Massilia horti]